MANLLYLAADGTVIVGEHGNGHLAIVGGPSRLKRLQKETRRGVRHREALVSETTL